MKAFTIIIIMILSLSFLFLSCARTVKLNRAEGVRGPNAPVMTADGVLFRIDAPQAVLVTIAGNFNGWNAQATGLKKDAQGTWSVVLPLVKGKKYQYKFVVDGYWIADPDNPDTEKSGSGSVTSVINVK